MAESLPWPGAVDVPGPRSGPSVARLVPQRTYDLTRPPRLFGLAHDEGAQLVHDLCRACGLQRALGDDARDPPAAPR